MNKSLPGGGEIVFLGGTPGNRLSPAWQKCEKAALNKNIKVVGTADTSWTRQGATAGHVRLPQQVPRPEGRSATSTRDGFLGAMPRYQAAHKPLNLVAHAADSTKRAVLRSGRRSTTRTSRSGLLAGRHFQSRIALTAGMMKLARGQRPVRRSSCTAKLVQVTKYDLPGRTSRRRRRHPRSCRTRC